MANVLRVIWVIVKVVGKYGVKKQTNKLINNLEYSNSVQNISN